MQMTRRVGVLLVYVLIGLGWVIALGLVGWWIPEAYHSQIVNWLALFFMTAVAFGYPIKGSWKYSKVRGYWAMLLAFFFVHVLGFTIILLHVERFPKIMFAAAAIAELIIITRALSWVIERKTTAS
jgi:hypothetical protein